MLACDPETAQKLHVNDTYRIVRALEVFELTGMPISQHQSSHQFQEKAYHCLKIGLTMDRKALYERINNRVNAMVQSGLLGEVKRLLERGYPSSLKSMQSIGYRHMADFLEGRLTWQETVRTLQRDTRRYAKRQLTWFGSDDDIHWLEPNQTEEMTNLVKSFVNHD